MPRAQRFTIIREDGSSTLIFDAAITYTMAGTVNVTEHAVEDGVRFADHAQPMPKTLSVRGVVSESPYDWQASTGGRDRVTAAIDFIEAIQGERVTVVTDRFGALEDMALSRWEVPATRTLDARFSLDFKQVRVATSESVEITTDTVVATTSTGAETPAAANLPDAVDAGEQPTTSTAANEALEEQDTSLLLDIVTWAGDPFGILD